MASAVAVVAGANVLSEPGAHDRPPTRPGTSLLRLPVTANEGPNGPLLSRPTGTVLVAGSDAGVVAIDVDSGEVEDLRLSTLTMPLAVDDRVVVIERGTAYAVRPFSGESPVALGAHVGPVETALTAGAQGEVWLIGHQSSTRMVRAVDLDDGGATSPLHHLPAHVSPLAGVRGGLLLDASGTLVVLDATTGDTRRVAEGEFVAAVGDTVLTHTCDEELNCGLRLTDLATGERRSISVPQGADGFEPWFPPVTSADGRWLLVPMRTTGFRQTAVVDLSATAPRAEHVSYVNVAPVLSPDGAWLFELYGEGIRAGRVEGPYVALDMAPTPHPFAFVVAVAAVTA